MLMKAKAKDICVFSQIKIGERFKDGNIVWKKVNKKEARSFGAIGLYNQDCVVERVKGLKGIKV